MAEESENAKKAMASDREQSEKSRAEFQQRMKGRPTPTQEENDLAMYGASPLEHSDDGSGPDPNVRSVEGRPGGGYQTRTVHPAAGGACGGRK